ncbi:LOW QUALITY PROTEIN: uncharacterized protein uimc1 [Tautogolabrus adspersus]
MALRKHALQDVDDVPSGSQHSYDNMQEGGAPDDQGDDRDDELSSSLLPRSPKERRRRERENKAKEMTEEEMMDLALRLSEHEASITALRVQKEEEAVMKAIQESMGESPTQACAPLASPEAALRLCSRRKLLYSNRKQDLEVGCSPLTTELNGEVKEAADDRRSLKRKRRAGSPLLEMPDLSQTQKISSQDSPCDSDPLDLQLNSQQVSLDLQLDSQQSCDSTQIDEGRSPVFPSTGCRAEVQVPRLSQNLLHSCRTSGFVLCSQDSSDDPQKSPPAQTKSPTFPQISREPAVFSETEAVDDSETQLSPEEFQSPVFGRTTQNQKSPSACRPQVCNSGFTSSSQESLPSSVRSVSCRPQSPVFPRILDLHKTIPPPERSGVCRSPVFSDEQTEQGHVGSLSQVLDRTGKRTKIQRAAAQIREDKKTDPSPGDMFTRSPPSDEELTEVIKDSDSAEMELSSDMKLLWSDGDDDMTHHVWVHPLLKMVPNKFTIIEAASGGGATVQYYWGVPFCPRGLNPDSYTQVILAQMEVYEKSLKEAQRCLLRKVEWGEAVLPQVEKSPLPESMSPEPPEPPEQEVHQRRVLRRRRKRLSEDVDDSPAAEGKEQEDKMDGDEEREKETKEEEKKSDGGGGGGGQGDSDDCEVCPETQLSNEAAADDRTQDLMMETDAGAQVSSNPPDFSVFNRFMFYFTAGLTSERIRPKSPESPDVQMILRDDSPVGDERAEEEEMETDAPVDTKMKRPSSVSNDEGGQAVRNGEEEAEEDLGDPAVEEVKGGRLQRSGSPELEPAVAPKTSVDCPICQGSFPLSQIEMHAAYCDGEVAVVHERRPRANCSQDSLKPRRKRTRRTDVREEEEENNQPSNSGKGSSTCFGFTLLELSCRPCFIHLVCYYFKSFSDVVLHRNTEKCYVCHKDVPLRDYVRHTELCIQRQESKTAARGSLLSALEHTDGRDSEAGPSGSKPVTGEVIDLLDDDDDEEGDGVSAPRVSDSPIRAFTPISEAADCLIDFKKQKRVKKLGQRRR